MSTRAHLVPVLHGAVLRVLFLPSTVTVTVWLPMGSASRAQTIWAGVTADAYRSITCGFSLSTCTCARPRSGPRVLTQAALPLTVKLVWTMVALAEPAAHLTLPPYAPVTVESEVQVPLNWVAAMLASSAGNRVNLGPWTQVPQV